ncbi:zinc-dependent alcohol dehydrogenase family protein [Sorangium sp. So ce1335]|uniref:zinc-dependent alcohol dehydrogenase family protein n=1 Tax=Sorangium sp. So ce1335 TaxID=3133335 RepID=UPI003F5D61AF
MEKRMRAWVLEGGFGTDHLRNVELPIPEPKRGQVLVRIHAASVNYRDLMVVDGQFDPSLSMPLVPLSDGAGEVVAAGEDARRLRAGDRVATLFQQKWLGGRPTPRTTSEVSLGHPKGGVLAQYVVLDEDGLVVLPPSLTYEEGSTLPIAAVTAWQALHVDAPVRPGDTVLVLGTGGVAVFAVQLARASGARVIVASSSDEKLARARELGATDLINYSATPDWDTRALELTGGVGVDVVVDIAGDVRRSVRALRSGGQVSLVGLLAGASAQLDVVPMLLKRARVQGISVGSRDMFEDLLRAVAHHRIKPVIHRVYPFEAAREAIEAQRRGEHVGKLVIAVA